MRRNIAKCLSLLALGSAGLFAQKADTIPFLVMMQPSNEVPAINDTSVGNTIIWVHVVRDASGAVTSGSVDFDVSTRFSGAVTVTGLHIHNAAAGVNGPILVPTDVNNSDKKIDIPANGVARIQKQVLFGANTTPSVSAATITDLLANPQNYYANIHTTVNAGGAMRGQLMPADMTVLMGLMSNKNEVPPTTTTGSGVASVLLLRAKDSTGKVAMGEAIFNLDYTNFEAGTTFTGFHIHNGAAGVNGPVIINTGLSGTNTLVADPSGSGNINIPVAITPSDATFSTEVDTLNSLFSTPNAQYINIHTTTAPGGIIRDQMRNTEKVSFDVNLSPANEVPAITGLNASAPSKVTLYLLRNNDGTVQAASAIFDVDFQGWPAGTTFTGLHIHQANAGTNGGIILPSGVDANANKVVSDTGSGNIYKFVNVNSAANITAVNGLVQNPNGFYENIHTTVNAGGAARDQLTPALQKPTVTGIADNVSTISTVAPGGIISIFGTNLSPITSSLDGFAGVTALTTGINGLTVTIGGVKAPFYFASPTQLNVQVPFEATAGAQPVVVTNAAGASTAFSVTVATVAPSIFQLQDGSGIVTKTNFSLVSSTNKVAAGDAIVVWMTGLGAVTPAVKTGDLVVAPTNGINTVVAPLTATIGGQNATVLGAAASPGFAGLYQVALTVPSGVTGNQPLVIRSGANASNSVTLAVQ